ncbi:MAG: rhodanese-like domain-containing protein [Anaerolineae bacterium]|nr:rhodanese-like domain-containing protein [Candidatus Roseilinea sp.]MDW8448466.1 rhodanese-like domain-containing protein [Anaerolineae bacterium]
MMSRKILARIEYLGTHPLTPPQVMQHILDGHVPVDARERAAFLKAHIPASLNIPASIFLQGTGHAVAFRKLIPRSLPVVIVSEPNAALVPLLHCLLKEHYQVAGCMAGGIAAWRAAGFPVANGESQAISPAQLYAMMQVSPPPVVVDVSDPEAYAAGHVPGALSIPLDRLEAHLHMLDPQRPLVLICAAGVRCRRAALQLLDQGFKEIYRVIGGTRSWIRAGLPVEAGRNLSQPTPSKPANSN